MSNQTLRLRPHHFVDIPVYYLLGTKGSYVNRILPENRTCGNGFAEGLGTLLERFWDGSITQLEIVVAEDDFCGLCKAECEDRYTSERTRIDLELRGLKVGETYSAEKIRQLIRNDHQSTRNRELPPL